MHNVSYEREKWYVRWYNYNKQQIPVIFTVIGSLIFTLFLDFKHNDFVFESHILAISDMSNRVVGFYLFAIYLIAIVQIANVLGFAKKRSPLSLFLFTGLSAIQVLLVYLYRQAFIVEVQTRTDGYVIPSYAHLSINIMVTGAIFFIIATIFAWFYVDWKYVKIED